MMMPPIRPAARAKHLQQAAMLILARRTWKPSPDDRIEIVELPRGWRIDVLASDDGKPKRHATFHEEMPENAVHLADSIRTVTDFPIRVIRRKAPNDRP